MKSEINTSYTKFKTMVKAPIFLLLALVFVSLVSCNKNNSSANWHKTGSFYIPASLDYEKEEIYRNDSLQVSTYSGKTATFKVTWIDQFNYKLTRLEPQNPVEQIPVIVKITEIDSKAKTLTFEANLENSTFFQRNKMIKVEEEEIIK
jgi:hypothetical protein